MVHDGRDVLALVDGHQVWRIGEQASESSATLDGAHAGCLVTHDGDVWLGGEGPPSDAGLHSNYLLAATPTAGGHVYVTVDGGRHWDRIDAALPPVTRVAVRPG